MTHDICFIGMKKCHADYFLIVIFSRSWNDADSFKTWLHWYEQYFISFKTFKQFFQELWAQGLLISLFWYKILLSQSWPLSFFPRRGQEIYPAFSPPPALPRQRQDKNQAYLYMEGISKQQLTNRPQSLHANKIANFFHEILWLLTGWKL